MTTSRLVLLSLALISFGASTLAQKNVEPDSLGLPGDNLNLYAVMKIFQESPTLEEFEKKLNTEELKINNLDLDGDGKIDYIRVVDHFANNVHDIVLQVPVTGTESQDIAVIQVEKTADNPARVQIIGDEALYGKDYIIEPNYDPASEKSEGVTPNPGYTGPPADTDLAIDGKPITVTNTTQAEVAGWPVIRYIYVPDYHPWLSPWHYSYYPPWWRPWRPYFWHYYWGYHYNNYFYYYGHYRRWHYYRNELVHNRYYNSTRSVSTLVLERKREGGYRRTYSRPDTRIDGLARYNRSNRGRLTKPMEGKPARPDYSRPGAKRREMDKPSMRTPSDQGRSRPGEKPRSVGTSRRDASQNGKPGATRPPRERSERPKEGRGR